MRDRLLLRLAGLLSTHPRATLLVTALATLLAALALPGMPVKSGHSSMVARDDPHRQRFERFLARFGSPDVLFVLVRGGSSADRRRVVDALGGELARDSVRCAKAGQRGCVRDVLGRVNVARLGRYALQFLPTAQLDALVELLADEHVGVTALLGARDIGELVERLADELEHRAHAKAASGATVERAHRVLAALRRLFEALDARLRGERSELLGRATAAGLVGASLRSAASVDERGYIGARDGSFHLLMVRPLTISDEPETVLPFVERVKAAAARAVRQACPGSCRGVDAQPTGLPAIIAAETRMVARDLWRTGLWAGAAVLLIFALGLRSLRQGLIGVLPLLCAVCGALAFARLCYGQLNLLTSAFVATVVGVGVDFSIHLLSRYNEVRAEGQAAAASARAALQGAGPGLLTGALTSALAFLTLMISDLEAFAQLGAICAVGLLLALLATVAVVTATLALPGARWLKKPPPPRRGDVGRAVAATVGRLRWPIVGVGLAAALLLGFAGRSVSWSYDYLALLPANAPEVKAMRRLARASVFSGEIAVTVAPDAARARLLAARLRALPSVRRVESLADYLPPPGAGHLVTRRRLRDLARAALRRTARPRAPAPRRVAASLQRLADTIEDVRFDATRAGRGELAKDLASWLPIVRRLRQRLRRHADPRVAARLSAASHELLDALRQATRWLAEARPQLDARRVSALLPAGLKSRLLSDGALALYIYPDGSLWRPGFLRRFVGQLRSVDPTITGFPVTHFETARAVERDLGRMLVLLVLVVFVVLLIDLRSLRATVLAVVPLGVGLCSSVGAMALLGLDYNFANILGFPLIVGIGIDSAVHLLHRAKQLGGGEHAARTALWRTGGAVTLSALTTMAGFGALALASHRGAASLGLLLLIGIGASVAASLLLLPALLTIGAKRCARRDRR